jgi:hypothetical protein
VSEAIAERQSRDDDTVTDHFMFQKPPHALVPERSMKECRQSSVKLHSTGNIVLPELTTKGRPASFMKTFVISIKLISVSAPY